MSVRDVFLHLVAAERNECKEITTGLLIANQEN